MSTSTDQLDIVFVDDHLLVVNKPPGLLSQEDITGDPDVLSLAKERLGYAPFVGLVHRLDRPASGLLVLARTSEAAAVLSEQFRMRDVEKRYLALVSGEMTGAGRIEGYMYREGRDVRVVSKETEDAVPAALQWRSVHAAAEASLVEVILKTGRKHQIRVQLANVGHPILGDVRYGSQADFPEGAIALHAYSLRINHPADRRFMQWRVAPPAIWPDTFAAHWQQLL